jgi:hypothetical protein
VQTVQGAGEKRIVFHEKSGLCSAAFCVTTAPRGLLFRRLPRCLSRRYLATDRLLCLIGLPRTRACPLPPPNADCGARLRCPLSARR